MEWPLNPYAIGICGGIPGFNILSLSVATKANISAASTCRKLKPSSTKSANCKLVSWKSLSRNIEMSLWILAIMVGTEFPTWLYC